MSDSDAGCKVHGVCVYFQLGDIHSFCFAREGFGVESWLEVRYKSPRRVMMFILCSSLGFWVRSAEIEEGYL